MECGEIGFEHSDRQSAWLGCFIIGAAFTAQVCPFLMASE